MSSLSESAAKILSIRTEEVTVCFILKLDSHHRVGGACLLRSVCVVMCWKGTSTFKLP